MKPKCPSAQVPQVRDLLEGALFVGLVPPGARVVLRMALPERGAAALDLRVVPVQDAETRDDQIEFPLWIC